MRPLLSTAAAAAALLLTLGTAATPAQAANAAPATAVAATPAAVELVAEGCGPHRHRIWRHHRSFCVHN